MDVKNVHKYLKGVRVNTDVNGMNDKLDAIKRYNQLLINNGCAINGKYLTEDGLLELLHDYIDYEVVNTIDAHCITCTLKPFINMNKS